jgi:hypothetical protein
VQILSGYLRISGGKLTRAQAMTGLRTRVQSLTRCYAEALERRPRLAGRLVYRLTVKTNGATTAARHMRGTITDKRLIRCGTAALMKTRFAKPRRSAAQVTIPFAFEPGTR